MALSDVQTWLAVGTVAGAVSAVWVIAVAVGRPLARLLRQNEEFREDWYGTPARPGREAVPGIPERMARLERTVLDAIGVTERLTRLELTVGEIQHHLAESARR